MEQGVGSGSWSDSVEMRRGVTQAEVLVNLGREDRLDREGLRRLVASINRYLGEPHDYGGGGDVRVVVGDALTVIGSRPMGASVVARRVVVAVIALTEFPHFVRRVRMVIAQRPSIAARWQRAARSAAVLVAGPDSPWTLSR